MIDILRLIEVSMATWYIAFAVTNTHGPFGVFGWIREHAPLGGLTSCIICLSPWIAVILLLLPDGVIIQALAVAALALMLHGFTGWRVDF